MLNLSQFAGSTPIGSIVQAPYNLTDPRFLLCNGAIINRADYPDFSLCAPDVGIFTATARTGRQLIPSGGGMTYNCITANGTNWCAVQGTSANIVQTSPDGITWTSRTTLSAAIHNLGWDGTNLVATGAGSGAYSTDNGVTWTAATGTVNTVATASSYGMAYAPTVGGSGRWLAVSSTTNTFSSDNRGVSWTQNTAVMPSFSTTDASVCWTGTRFLVSATLGRLYASNDGITSWSTIAIAGSRTVSGRLVSNGAGRVAFWDTGTHQLWYSLDHGATWASRSFGTVFLTSTASVVGRIEGIPNLSFTNNRFFLATGTGAGSTFLDHQFFCSTDLTGWVPMLGIVSVNASIVPSQNSLFSHKAGVYWVNDTYIAASGMTLTEDTTKIRLPPGSQGSPSGALPSAYNNFQPFIRVK